VPLVEAKKLNLLRKLQVSHNSLKMLCALPNMVKLSSLDVSHNEISTIELDSLPSLSSLNMSHNQLKDLNGLE